MLQESYYKGIYWNKISGRNPFTDKKKSTYFNKINFFIKTRLTAYFVQNSFYFIDIWIKLTLYIHISYYPNFSPITVVYLHFEMYVVFKMLFFWSPIKIKKICLYFVFRRFSCNICIYYQDYNLSWFSQFRRFFPRDGKNYLYIFSYYTFV